MSVIFSSILSDTFQITDFLLCLGAALLCGIIIAFAVKYKNNITKSFFISLILLPAIVNTVIIMVNGNVGTGIAVAGAFSLVRFRSAPGKAKDIACIFLAMTSGLACAAGYIGIAVLFSVLVSVVLMVLMSVPMSADKTMDLHITIPESLQYSHEFDDLLAQYTKKAKLIKVKTSNMGSLYKLWYKIEMKNPDSTKEFIDQLRCRNGNLEISISEIVEGSDEL